jgi:hypothetical protein
MDNNQNKEQDYCATKTKGHTEWPRNGIRVSTRDTLKPQGGSVIAIQIYAENSRADDRFGDFAPWFFEDVG